MHDRCVLVTGGGGFVGSHLALGFARLGWRVIAIDREFDLRTQARLRGVELVAADLSHDLHASLPPAQLIVHAAATTTDSAVLGCTPRAHVASNLRPLECILEVARRQPPHAFVFLSSSGVFAVGDGLECLADVDLPSARTPYGVAKQLGETMTGVMLEGLCPAHVVRLGYVYGPHETARRSRMRVSAVAEWLAAARDGRPLEIREDDPRRDWTFAPDLAGALARLVERPPRRRPVHLASPHVLNDRAMAGLILDHFPGRTCSVTDSPGPAKPPMRPTDVCCLRAFPWTDPATAVAGLVAEPEPA